MISLVGKIGGKAGPDSGIDIALFLLRFGLAVSFVLLFALRQSQGDSVYVDHPTHAWFIAALVIGAPFVVCGYCTALAAGLSSIAWSWALCSGLHAGAAWYSLPVRAALYAIIFAALTITGPGKYSLDYRLRDGSPKSKGTV